MEKEIKTFKEFCLLKEQENNMNLVYLKNLAKLEKFYNNPKRSFINMDFGAISVTCSILFIKNNKKTLYINKIYSKKRSKGEGTKILNLIKDFAIDNNIIISLKAEPLAEGASALNTKKLVEWYKKHDFKIREDLNPDTTDEEFPFMVFNF